MMTHVHIIYCPCTWLIHLLTAHSTYLLHTQAVPQRRSHNPTTLSILAVIHRLYMPMLQKCLRAYLMLLSSHFNTNSTPFMRRGKKSSMVQSEVPGNALGQPFRWFRGNQQLPEPANAATLPSALTCLNLTVRRTAVPSAGEMRLGGLKRK